MNPDARGQTQKFHPFRVEIHPAEKFACRKLHRVQLAATSYRRNVDLGERDVRNVVVFAVINLVALGSLTGPAVIGLPMLVARLVAEDSRTATLAFVITCGAVTAIVTNPLFGVVSDLTSGRFGKRRPWLIVGVLVGLGGSVLVLTAESVAMLAIAWIIAQTGYNASLAAVAGLVGDQVEERQRSSVSGVFGAAAFLGTLPPLLLAALVPARLDVIILAMPVVAVIVVTICCAVVSDPPLTREVRMSLPRGAARELRRIAYNRQFMWIWLQRFLMQLAFSLATCFTLYFVMIRIGGPPEGAAPVVAVSTFIGGTGIVLASLVVGFIAGKHGNYRPYLVAAACGLALAGVLRATATSEAQLWIAAAIGGISLGAFFTVDLALALRTVPRGSSGSHLGMLNVAETLPQAIAPAVAIAVLAAAGPDPLAGVSDNYFMLYLTAALIALIALIPMVFLRSVLTRTAPAISSRLQEAHS